MPKLKKVPFQITNENKSGKHVLTLSGVIQKRFWSGDKRIDAELVREALDDVSDDIVIKLNSNGGDVFQGIEIYNYLKDHPSNIVVEVVGVAASAATFILAGADEVIMNVGTSIMIHEAETITWGNKSEIQKTLNTLETIDESILNIYQERTGQSAEQLTSWIKEEKWFTADEAVKYGFADSVKKKESEEPQNIADISAMINEAVAVAFANQSIPTVTNEQTKPKPKSLIDKLRKGE